MDAWWLASDSRFSDSGTGVLPAIRVRIRVWEISGSVYSRHMAAAAAKAAVTPGITVNAMFLAFKAAICSKMAP